MSGNSTYICLILLQSRKIIIIAGPNTSQYTYSLYICRIDDTNFLPYKMVQTGHLACNIPFIIVSTDSPSVLTTTHHIPHVIIHPLALVSCVCECVVCMSILVCVVYFFLVSLKAPLSGYAIHNTFVSQF